MNVHEIPKDRCIRMYSTIHGYDCPSLSENKCMSFFDKVHNFIFKKPANDFRM